MATLGFQIHVDKEIAKPVNHRHASSSGHRSKTFQESGTPGVFGPRKTLGDVNTPAHGRVRAKAFGSIKAGKTFQESDTPASARARKALGIINGTQSSTTACKPGSLKPVSLCGPSLKKPELGKSQEQSVKKLEPSVKNQDLSVTVASATVAKGMPQVEECEEMEQMFNERDPDSDDDVWPVNERVSTYIDKLISWRPNCLFGSSNVSDDEEEDERRIQEMMSQLDELPPPAALSDVEKFMHVDIATVPEPEDDMPFADISIDEFCTPHPLSALEDSYSTMPNLGSLVLVDDV